MPILEFVFEVFTSNSLYVLLSWCTYGQNSFCDGSVFKWKKVWKQDAECGACFQILYSKLFLFFFGSYVIILLNKFNMGD